MTMRLFLRLALGVLIACIFFWLLIKNISLEEAKDILHQASFAWLFLAIFFFFLGYTCRIQRWRLMLSLDNSTIKWQQCAGPFMASIAANNVLPLRAGDIIRCFGFNGKLGINVATSISALLVERLLDVFMLLLFLGLANISFSFNFSSLTGLSGGGLIAAAIGVFLMLLFPSLFKPLILSINYGIDLILPKIGKALHTQFQKIFAALDQFSQKLIMSQLLLWSFLAWCGEGVVFLLVAKALPTLDNVLAGLLAFPLGTLATIIPSTPGYAGTFDYFTAQAMIFLGNTVASATVYALLIHIVLWLPATVAGGFYFLFNPVHIKK